MDINALNPIGAYRAQLNKTSQDNRAANIASSARSSATSTVSKQSDTVSISPDVGLRNTAMNTALQSPNVRQEKVDALKEKVASGEYNIDNRKIANKLVMSEKALLGK